MLLDFNADFAGWTSFELRIYLIGSVFLNNAEKQKIYREKLIQCPKKYEDIMNKRLTDLILSWIYNLYNRLHFSFLLFTWKRPNKLVSYMYIYLDQYSTVVLNLHVFKHQILNLLSKTVYGETIMAPTVEKMLGQGMLPAVRCYMLPSVTCYLKYFTFQFQ